MSSQALVQITLTDDDGSGTTGTILNNALFGQVQDAVDNAIEQLLQTKSANYTVLVTDDVVKCTASLTLTLYTAVGNGGRAFEAANTASSGIVTLDPDGAQTIDGASTLSLGPGESVRIRSDNANWFSVGSPIGGSTVNTVLGIQVFS